MTAGYITVTKEEAKRLIDEAPGDKVTISVIDSKSRFHLPTERKMKRIGKEMIELAREIGYQDNDFFGVIGCFGNIMTNADMKFGNIKDEENLIRNIMFPMTLPPNYK